MLPLILTATKLLAMLGMTIAGVSGFLLPDPGDSQIHHATGMISTLLLGAAQIMTVWYFDGNSHRILRAADDCRLPENVRAETAGLRRLVVPRGYLVLLLTTGTLIAGGGTLLADLPAWPHIGLAIVTMIAGLYTAFIEYIAFRFNAALNERLAKTTEATTPSTPMPIS
jgi:hypothetical protein